MQGVVEHRVAEQLGARHQAEDRQPGRAVEAVQAYAADQAHHEQDRRADAVADGGVGGGADAGPGPLAERGVDGREQSADHREQVAGERPAGDAEVGAGGEHRAEHRHRDSGPHRRRQPPPLPAGDQPLPHRLRRPERGRGRHRGELRARHPGGEVGGQGDPGEYAVEPLAPARPDCQRPEFGAPPGQRDRAQDRHRQRGTPERHCQRRRGGERHERRRGRDRGDGQGERAHRQRVERRAMRNGRHER